MRPSPLASRPLPPSSIHLSTHPPSPPRRTVSAPLTASPPVLPLQVDDVESLCPVMDCKAVDDVSKTSPGCKSLVTLCGRSARSSLRILSHGLAVSEMAVSELPGTPRAARPPVRPRDRLDACAAPAAPCPLNPHPSPLAPLTLLTPSLTSHRPPATLPSPGNPNAVWTVKKRRSDEHDAYIVVSFVNATLVLSIGETVEEVTDSGLKAETPTLFTCLFGEDSIVQVMLPHSPFPPTPSPLTSSHPPSHPPHTTLPPARPAPPHLPHAPARVRWAPRR